MATTDALNAEISDLRLKLQKSEGKLSEWKAKTKSGVDQLREQVVQLTHQLSLVQSENTKLRSSSEQNNDAPAKAQDADSANNDVSDAWQDAGAMHAMTLSTMRQHEQLCSALVAWMGDRTEATVDAVASHFNEALQQSRSNAANAINATAVQDLQNAFDKYKKRAEQSIKLSSKQQEAMSADNKQLREELDRALAELRGREQRADENTLSMEKQLDTALFTIDTLRAEMADRQLQAQVQQRNAVEHDRQLIPLSEAKAEMTRVHNEFCEREERLRQQQRDDIERLVRTHEEEMSMLEDELRAAQRQEQQAGHGHQSAIAPQPEMDDEAYMLLLQERDDLLRALQQRDAQIVQLTAEKPSTPNTTNGSPTSKQQQRDVTPAALQCRIAELEKLVQTLSEQLWAANNAMLETRAKKNSESAAKGKSPEAQQSSYLKSIVVKLLCEKANDVRANLIPVLTTLLHLEPEDLRTIFIANPEWVK